MTLTEQVGLKQQHECVKYKRPAASRALALIGRQDVGFTVE